MTHFSFFTSNDDAMHEKHKLEDYDAEPVKYCSRCYSLKIGYEESIDSECCLDCGSSDISTTSIENWEKMYEQRYGHKFTEKSKDPRHSLFFKMSVGKLKSMLYHHPLMMKFVHELYPDFPGGLSRADTLIMLFDQLSKDNRIDDLRYMLYVDSRRS